MAYLLETSTALVHREGCKDLKYMLTDIVAMIAPLDTFHAVKVAEIWYWGSESEPPYPIAVCSGCTPDDCPWPS